MKCTTGKKNEKRKNELRDGYAGSENAWATRSYGHLIGVMVSTCGNGPNLFFFFKFVDIDSSRN